MSLDLSNLSNKHRKTLKAVFSKPIRSDIAWTDIEKLFTALGAKVAEGRGSRVRVFLNDRVAVFHRPHPEKDTDKGAVAAVQKFLSRAGVDSADI